MGTLSDTVERRGMIKGEIRGEIRGAEKTRIEIASALINEGLSDSFISKTTKLSFGEIADLRKKNGSRSN